MENPENIDLPFFAYGIFQPGQLGFHRLKDFVGNVQAESIVKGSLLIRDGLPIADPQSEGEIRGAILTFKAGLGETGYTSISDIEPDKHYRWGTAKSNGVSVNILWGRSPQKGSQYLEDEWWDGKHDPLFTDAIDVVKEVLLQNTDFQWDNKPFFRLQMAYLLLWSSIERYASLRYHLGDKVTEKVNSVANEPAFAEALHKYVKETRSVFRTDKPGEKETLSPNNPQKAIRYYYQVRSNMTHRGKAAVQDFDMVHKSLSELTQIFDEVRNAAFATETEK